MWVEGVRITEIRIPITLMMMMMLMMSNIIMVKITIIIKQIGVRSSVVCAGSVSIRVGSGSWLLCRVLR